ncbi:MAG: dTDP-4-keto-6-deoxy-D-glucose epimerase [Hyphomonas sp.]|uniref:dTDP-4-dehydrorhamnose 3,5-epimerase n=1 Tax=Hyphomonas sp. TaxID=87 RepID=UPI00183BFE0F|nr:dTDP-4-dehydrorhamnose 3,5-epimerase [Hyphomonas sp.]MBA3067795.1 dTDP-4-keto-6-deoxy-D-glucose epimerase [Hyphomonas sp.]MBU4063918.1 dTDP-4-dehydrorhamnose 3,5-epimerase [Alphaproteobacteria bacterium]MBU4163284.1 dTDP-4-dehydrorhamnose 3,5-epimerase [Alphaproteobacteria bacterium]
MNLIVTPDPILPEVLLVQSAGQGDAQDWHSEAFNEAAFQVVGIPAHTVQDNHSRSAEAGPLRGHLYQAAQAKLVRCVRCPKTCVIVDFRGSSSCFGHHITPDQNEADRLQVFPSEGFAYGFGTLKPGSDGIYKITACYSSALDFGIVLDSLALAIRRLFAASTPTLSERDCKHLRITEAPQQFAFSGASE